MARILVVDDDAEDRMILQSALKKVNGFDVIDFAENGILALELVEELSYKQSLPSLIVLDLNMPKMNGTETLMMLKSDPRFKEIPVIIYSTSINPLEQQKCISLGAHSYIIKPISYQESLDTAKAFLQLSERSLS